MTETTSNTPALPPRLQGSVPSAPTVEKPVDTPTDIDSDLAGVEALTVMVDESEEPAPGYTLIPVDDEEEERTPLFTAGMTAWMLATVFGLIAPFGSVAVLDLFPGLVEGLIRLDRNLLASVDFVLLAGVLAAVMVAWAVVISCLAVCIGKRPGFWTGSALAVFLIGPPAILLGLPALSLFFS